MLKARSIQPRLEVLEDRSVPSTFTVRNPNDAGPGSLRQAVLDANVKSGADTIVFRPGLEGTIRLSSGEMTITDHVTIKGPGAARMAVSGNFSSRIFNVDDGDGQADLNVKIQGLELRHGNSVGGGGAIFSAEHLALVNMVFTQNTASNNGGAVDGAADVTVTRCTFSGNTTSLWGGALSCGDATIRGSTISSNSAGGLGGGVSCGTATITGSTISGNSAADDGGGVFATVSARITASTIAGNSAADDGGGIFGGDVTITRSTITHNASASSGGGVLCFTAAITSTTFAHNRSMSGAGLCLPLTGGTSDVRNCTFSGNRATANGGAIFFAAANLNVRNTTIAFNYAGDKAGGISHFGGSCRLESCLVADNDAGNAGKNLNSFNAGTVFQLDHCLISLHDGAPIQDFAGNPISPGNPGNNLFDVDPLLAPLAFNGGKTQTHALKKGSPAINRGNNSAGLATDQRGAGFPRRLGSAVDIGAFERQ
jgi:predicted outer membrane repeat protein